MSKKQNGVFHAKGYTAILAVLVAVGAVTMLVSTTAGKGDWAITRRVVDVPFEIALKAYVGELRKLEGVTSASYNNYDPMTKSALVTVTYDPKETAPKIIEAWLGNTTSIWEKSVQA